MNDFDIKGIERYRKQIITETKKDDRRRLSFAKPSRDKVLFRASDFPDGETAGLGEAVIPSGGADSARIVRFGGVVRSDGTDAASKTAHKETPVLSENAVPAGEIACINGAEDGAGPDETVSAAEKSGPAETPLSSGTARQGGFPSPAVTAGSAESAGSGENKTSAVETPAECFALINILQPARDDRAEVLGVDNRTGRHIRSIIYFGGSEAEERAAEPAEEPAREKRVPRGRRPAESDGGLSLPRIIYLPGNICTPGLAERLKNKILTPRLAAAAVFLALFLAPLLTFYSVGTFCYLAEAGDVPAARTPVWSAEESPREIAAEITALNEADRVDVTKFGSTPLLTVVRSYPVSLTADGQTESVNVLDATVEEFLTEQGVEVSEYDILSHDPDYMLKEGDELVVQRVDYVEREPVTEPLEFRRLEKNSPLLSGDSEYTVREGEDGSAERVYLDRFVDGVLESSELVEETVLLEPVDELTVTGDPSAPASTVDIAKYAEYAGIEIVDGAPSEYRSVMEDAVCTAYSFGGGIFGASGMELIQGSVAVNPDVIPYGTLMYIASDRFTYGWAIAADCGTAMMEGYVDIDCYFETYDESVMFGKKLLDVYIVGMLSQEQLEEFAANGMFYDRVPTEAEVAATELEPTV